MSLCVSNNSTTDLTVAAADARLAFAADELARYLAIVTGAHFPLGEGPERAVSLQINDAPTEEHGWDIRPDGLTLFGHDTLSVLHAVYHFLEEHCGCRWLAEFEDGEIIPRRETLSVPCEQRRFRPDFAQRAFTNYPDIDRLTVAMCDWMAKQRFNRFMIFANAEGAFEAYEQVLQREVVARGLKIELGHHSCKYFMPPSELFDTHPEYFALIQGERSPRGQLCTSSPEVVALVAERISRLMSAHPEIDTVGLWPNDGYGWCECERCLALEPQEPSRLWPGYPRRTDTYLQFVNQVAELVAQDHPDGFLSALFYVNYVEPPRQVEVLPQVKVYFAPFQRCFRHPLGGAPDCRRPNVQYAEMLRQWRPLVPGQLLLFEYLMLIDMVSVPYPLYRLLPEDFRFYRDLGVEGYVLEYRPAEWGPYGQHAHLIGELSWDADADVQAALDGHFSDLYGPAAGEMMAFWTSLEERFGQGGGCVHHYDLGYTRRATHQLLRPALDCLGRAVALAASAEPRHREAVAQAQVSAQLLLLLGRWQDSLHQAMKIAKLADDAIVAAQELVDFAQRHADSGALFAPGIMRRVEGEMARLQ
ncbi:DUF4838 domain-containing protein [bacterium]|nr:DUF4838 domain-containing protein [bacterium]